MSAVCTAGLLWLKVFHSDLWTAGIKPSQSLYSLYFFSNRWPTQQCGATLSEWGGKYVLCYADTLLRDEHAEKERSHFDSWPLSQRRKPPSRTGSNPPPDSYVACHTGFTPLMKILGRAQSVLVLTRLCTRGHLKITFLIMPPPERSRKIFLTNATLVWLFEMDFSWR